MSQQLHTHTHARIIFVKCRPHSVRAQYASMRMMNGNAKWTAPGRADMDHFRTSSHSIINFIVHVEFQCGKKNETTQIHLFLLQAETMEQKNSEESWKSQSMCGVRSFVYAFHLLHPSRTTLAKTHWIPKPIRVSTWIPCVCACGCASFFRLLQFRWMNFSSAFSSLFIPSHRNGIPHAINKQENRIPRRSLEIHSNDGSQKFLIQTINRITFAVDRCINSI